MTAVLAAIMFLAAVLITGQNGTPVAPVEAQTSPSQTVPPTPQTVVPIKLAAQSAPKPVTMKVKVNHLRVRKVPTVSGNRPVGRLNYGAAVPVKRTIKTKSDPYHDGRNQWSQLTNGTWVWAGGLSRTLPARKPAPAVKPKNTAAWYAQAILNNHKITYDNKAGRADLVRTARGQAITHCGKTVRLNRDLLRAVWMTSQHFKFRINAVDSDHHCNRFKHPKGRAMDFGRVNGVRATPTSLHGSTYRRFEAYLGSQLPSGSAFMQGRCTGHVSLPRGVKQYQGDACNHLHANV